MDMYNLKQIPSEAQVVKYIRRIVFGSHMFCPMCRSRNVLADHARYRCRVCRGRFSLVSHTWLSNMKLPLTQFWMIVWCWTIQIPVKQTVTITRLSEVTIRHWFDQFRHHLPYNQEVLEHMVQLDEAYFGGRNGSALLMAKEVGTGNRKLAYQIIPSTSVVREHVSWFLQTNVKPGSRLHTDGAKIYDKIDQWWPVYHYRDIHKKFEFELTSKIEGTFGVLRTFIRRMYHHVTVDKLPDYVGEFCYRFSHPEIFDSPYQYLLISLRLVTTA